MNEPKVIENIRTGITALTVATPGYVPPYISEEMISDESIMDIINTHIDSLTAVRNTSKQVN